VIKMFLTIDPDVFTASCKNDNKCQRILEEMSDQITKGVGCNYEFAVDKTLYNEYCNFFVQHQNKGDLPAVQILKLVLDNFYSVGAQTRNERVSSFPLSATLPDNIRTMLPGLTCETPVEPELIGVGYNIRKKGAKAILRLLLVGHDNVRQRGLHRADVEHQVWKLIPWMEVLRASDYSSFNPLLSEKVEDSSAVSKLFESSARDLLCQTLGFPPYYAQTPKSINDGREIQADVYIYTLDGNPREIWVGECKCRKTGNEEKPIDSKEIRQLIRILNAVASYESNRKDVPDYPIKVMGYMISNVNDMDDQAWSLAKEFSHKYADCVGNETRQVAFAKILFLRANWNASEHRVTNLTPFDKDDNGHLMQVDFKAALHGVI